MGFYLYVVLGYLLVLGAFNFLRARQVKSQEDFMVAGRKLSLTTVVFTLVCTWIGSGTFIAGAEYAARAGWSALWLPAGAWIGIGVIYFLAARIRTFGQYTVGDILEVRYGKYARLFGAIALVVAFTTIVSYQFRAGGYILNIATKGAVSVEAGQAIAAGFVILFTALGGMVAVAHTDVPNGIIILVACCAALPFVILFAGGPGGAAAHLPPQHFAVFAADFGRYPALKAGSYFLATLLLLMGIQSMYRSYTRPAPRPRRGAPSRCGSWARSWSRRWSWLSPCTRRARTGPRSGPSTWPPACARRSPAARSLPTTPRAARSSSWRTRARASGRSRPPRSGPWWARPSAPRGRPRM
ncbi:MAG: hypothetical protein HY744_14845 [Deltaproteobacteria bacterium]|nr:hypothetical protein [Deltaproteobacteria bacterium]